MVVSVATQRSYHRLWCQNPTTLLVIDGDVNFTL